LLEMDQLNASSELRLFQLRLYSRSAAAAATIIQIAAILRSAALEFEAECGLAG